MKCEGLLQHLAENANADKPYLKEKPWTWNFYWIDFLDHRRLINYQLINKNDAENFRRLYDIYLISTKDMI